MSSCIHCEIKDCGVLNPSECPINKLWAKAERLNEYIREINELVIAQMWINTELLEQAKEELVSEAEALVNK